MKKSANLAVALIGLMLAMPAIAQEEAEASDQAAETTADTGTTATDEAAPAEEAAAEGEVAAEASESAAAAPEDTAAETPADDASAEAAATDEAAADAAAMETPPEGESAEAAAVEGESADAGAEAAPVEDTASSEEASSESSGEESASSEESGSEESSSGDSEPFHLYAGIDKAEVRVSFSDDALATKFGDDKLNSSFYRLRVGTRFFDAIGVEAHYGISDQDDSGEGNFEVGEYYGAFVVPTGVFLDVVEISAPIGYTFMKVERAGASEKFDAMSFGLNIEVPIILESEWIPEIRIGGGGTVYQSKNDARIYGYHFGVRLDFKL